MDARKLYRSRENRMICGVCGGVGEYFCRAMGIWKEMFSISPALCLLYKRGAAA